MASVTILVPVTPLAAQAAALLAKPVSSFRPFATANYDTCRGDVHPAPGKYRSLNESA